MDYLQPKFYRFSEDSIWLAELASSKIKKRPLKLLDVGCGCGVVGIETANRTPSIKEATFLEPQKEFFIYLQANTRLLKRSLKITYENRLLESFNPPTRFDLIVSNPPYFNLDSNRTSPNKNKAMCRSFHDSSLIRFISLMEDLLAPEGEAYILARESNKDVEKVMENGMENLSVTGNKNGVLLLKLIHKQRS